MKTKILSPLIIFSLLILFACHNKYKSKTRLFETYLKEDFQKKIENGIYVVMPLNLCGSCVEKMILKINRAKDNNLTIILVDYTSVTFNEPKSKLKGFKFLLDNKMNIVKNNIISGRSIVVFQVTENQIDKVVEYQPDINDKEVENILR